MGWASSSERRLRHDAGGDCPRCKKKGALCMNGNVSVYGHKIVTCHECGAILCARCGQDAVKTTATQETKYACASCKL